MDACAARAHSFSKQLLVDILLTKHPVPYDQNSCIILIDAIWISPCEFMVKSYLFTSFIITGHYVISVNRCKMVFLR